MNLSIVIPLLNEEESLIELHNWIVEVMQSNRFSYEILFIDDGSTDGSWDIITQLSDKNPNVKGLRFKKNFGKSQALHAGFKAANGDVVITMDADLQDNPEEILTSQEKAYQVQQAILSLPLKYREVTVLRHLKDLSYIEIASILKIPTGTVKIRLYRAREQLRETFKNNNSIL